MTIEQLTKELATAKEAISALEAEKVTLTGDIKVLKDEQAVAATEKATATSKYDELQEEVVENRKAKSSSMKKAFAAETILAKNNIKVELDKLDLGTLTIADGVVSGEIDYTPDTHSNLGAGNDPTRGENGAGITKEQVASMSVDEVRDNWAAVETLLKT